jgi:hypothetical protein
MRSLRISLIVTLIVAAFLCMGFAAALNQDEASVHTFFSPTTLQPGQTVTVNIIFTSNSSGSLQITRVGLNFDWMASDNFVGFDLSSAPVTVASGGTYTFPQMTINVPANVTVGVHNYFVGIDGTQGASSTTFSWNSPTLSVAVIGSSGQTVSPTVTTSPTGGGGQQGAQPDLQLYGAVAAAVVIVVLLVIVLVLRRKRTKPQPAPSQTAAQQETPPPEQKPEQKPNSEQDFNI